LEGAEKLGYGGVSSPAQNAELVAEAQKTPFVSARDLKADTAFHTIRYMRISSNTTMY